MILNQGNTTTGTTALSADLKNQFTEVDEAYFRESLNQKSLHATLHVFSAGCITFMADQSFNITAAVQRPQAGAGNTKETAPKVTYLLPLKSKVPVPMSLRLKSYASLLNKTTVAFALRPLVILFTLPRLAMAKLVSPPAKVLRNPTDRPEWHSLRLTSSELST